MGRWSGRMVCVAGLCLPATAGAAGTPPLDRLAVESLLVEQGFSGAAIRADGPDWRGEGDRDGRVLRFVVERGTIRVLDSRVGGAGPIADPAP